MLLFADPRDRKAKINRRSVNSLRLHHNSLINESRLCPLLRARSEMDLS